MNPILSRRGDSFMSTKDPSRQPDDRSGTCEVPVMSGTGPRKLEVTIDADLLDFAEDQSFPASDPPAVTSIRPVPDTRTPAMRDPSKRGS
jgi:hypothetical protein